MGLSFYLHIPSSAICFVFFCGIRVFLLCQNHVYGDRTSITEKIISLSKAFHEDLIKDSNSPQFFKAYGLFESLSLLLQV